MSRNTLNNEVDKKILEEILKEEEEFKEIRRKYANWNFIKKQKPRIRAALEYYIETGDIRRACKIAGINISLFRNLLRKANIPVIT